MIIEFPFLYEMAYGKVKELIHDNLYTDVEIKRRSQINNPALGAANIAITKCIEKIIFDFRIDE